MLCHKMELHLRYTFLAYELYLEYAQKSPSISYYEDQAPEKNKAELVNH